MVSVDQEKCIGCGLCTATAPDCFEIDEKTYKAKVKKDCKCDEKCRQAIENCPVGAITA